jgi:magnesium chelatase family protein
MDRIDLKCWVPPLQQDAFSAPAGESSATIRQRVISARLRQQHRYEGLAITRNAQLEPGMFELCSFSEEAMAAARAAQRKLALSTRGVDVLLKVARTCADLREAEGVEEEDIHRACRFMDVPLPKE